MPSGLVRKCTVVTDSWFTVGHRKSVAVAVAGYGHRKVFKTFDSSLKCPVNPSEYIVLFPDYLSHKKMDRINLWYCIYTYFFYNLYKHSHVFTANLCIKVRLCKNNKLIVTIKVCSCITQILLNGIFLFSTVLLILIISLGTDFLFEPWPWYFDITATWIQSRVLYDTPFTSANYGSSRS